MTFGMISGMTEARRPDYCLATDLDGTVTGDDAAEARLCRLIGHLGEHLLLIYLTGRYPDSARGLIRVRRLPEPDVLVTDIGSQIFRPPDPRPDFGWARLSGAASFPAAAVEVFLGGVAGLVPQGLPPELPRRSFRAAGDRDAVARGTAVRLKAAGLDCRVIASGEADIDVLPHGAGKGPALSYVLARLPRARHGVLVAGDSGNDRDMLTAGYPAVIVGSGESALDSLSHRPQVYRAQGAAAAGIIEGMRHWGWRLPRGF